MKRVVLLLFVLSLLPGALWAQSLGQVRYGGRVYSTGFPRDISHTYDPETGDYIKMSAERRQIALRCVEKTFGPIRDYREYYGDCTGVHMLEVNLTCGDRLFFDNGCLGAYNVVSSRYPAATDMFYGGQRVGRKPNFRKKEGVVLSQDEKDPAQYSYYWEGREVYGYFILDEKGLIKEIAAWSNDC